MQTTLLKLVQNTLSKMDSDEVNSISDTIESEQIADCYRTIYEQIVTQYDLPVKISTIRLGGTDNDTNGKARLFLEGDLMTISNIRYDCRTESTDAADYRTISLVSNDVFLKSATNIDTSQDNVEDHQYWPGSPAGDWIGIGVYNDRPPSICTIVSDGAIQFNAYDKNIDTNNLLSSKSLITGQIQDELTIDDDTEVTLPGNLLILLETNATELAFDLFKGSTPPKISNLASKSRTRQQRSKNIERNRTFSGPDYGRTPTNYRKWPQDSGVDGSEEEPLPPWWPT